MPVYHEEIIANCQNTYKCVLDSLYSDTATTKKDQIVLAGNPLEEGCTGSGSIKVMDSYGNTGIGTRSEATRKILDPKKPMVETKCTKDGVEQIVLTVDVRYWAQTCNGKLGNHSFVVAGDCGDRCSGRENTGDDTHIAYDYIKTALKIGDTADESTVSVIDGLGNETSETAKCDGTWYGVNPNSGEPHTH